MCSARGGRVFSASISRIGELTQRYHSHDLRRHLARHVNHKPMLFHRMANIALGLPVHTAVTQPLAFRP